MDLEIDYTKLTVKELTLLILADNKKAVDEHIRRIKSGEIKPTRSYTLEQITEMAEKSKRKVS